MSSSATNRVIICPDYSHIFITLYLLQQSLQSSRSQESILVIPGYPDLYRLFQVVNDKVFNNSVNLVHIAPYPARRASDRGMRKYLSVIPDIIGERRYLRNAFTGSLSGTGDGEVFFFSRGYSPLTFYLMKKLGKGFRWVYMPNSSPETPVAMMAYYKPSTVDELINLAIMKLIYGWGITLGQFPAPYDRGFAFISDKAMKRVDKVIDLSARKEMVKDFDISQFKVFDTERYQVIYFDDGLVEFFGVADWETYKSELAMVFKILTRHFPESQLATKPHPGHPINEERLTIGDVLPAFVPAELLCNDNTKVYLSLFSSAIANVGQGLAVSIADLVTFKDDRLKNTYKEYLSKRCSSRLIFPQSLAEFEDIIVSLKSG